MSKVFTRRFRVRYSEIGVNGWVSPANYLRYVVETAYDWGAANQLGMVESEELGLAWVIRETALDIFRQLTFGDEFDLTIWLMDWRRVRGTRGFKLALANTRDVVAQGVQKVVCLDNETMRPVTPPDRFMGNFRLDDPPQIPIHRYPKNPDPLGEVHRIQRRVDWSDLDSLDMVYNAVYLNYAEDAVMHKFASNGSLIEGLQSEGLIIAIHSLQVKYLMPAYWSDSVNIKSYYTGISENGLGVNLEIQKSNTQADLTIITTYWGVYDLETGKRKHISDKILSNIGV